MKKVAIVSMGDKSFLDFLSDYLKMYGIKCSRLNNPSEISNEHTNIVFVAEGMCEIAEQVQKDNPEKTVILLTGGIDHERSCVKHIIPIQKGRPELMVKKMMEKLNT